MDQALEHIMSTTAEIERHEAVSKRLISVTTFYPFKATFSVGLMQLTPATVYQQSPYFRGQIRHLVGRWKLWSWTLTTHHRRLGPEFCINYLQLVYHSLSEKCGSIRGTIGRTWLEIIVKHCRISVFLPGEQMLFPARGKFLAQPCLLLKVVW